MGQAMTIDIENDVPLPDDGWVSAAVNTPKAAAPSSPAYDPPTAGPNDCTFIGGPLNGKFGPIKGNAKVVEIELYNTDGSVSSVELYSLGDNPTPTFRYHVGSKQP